MVDFTRRSRLVSRAMLAASAALAISSSVFADDATTAPAPAERAGSMLSYSAGVDVTSHFISFGADVWGGGNNAFPLTSKSTTFVYGTLTAKFTDELSGYVNLWSDDNDNVDSGIGGPIQEVDFNVGVNYTMGDFTFGLAHAYWMFGGGAEKAIEASVSYNDAELWEKTLKGFALNPSFLAHYRYDSTGDLTGQDACVLQFGVKPTYTFDQIDDYPITVSVPASLGYFTDPYQGGNGAGVGYINVGVSATAPLAFVPKGYGNWSVSLSEIYYHTYSSDIPSNPSDNFFVTTVSVGVAF